MNPPFPHYITQMGTEYRLHCRIKEGVIEIYSFEFPKVHCPFCGESLGPSTQVFESSEPKTGMTLDDAVAIAIAFMDEVGLKNARALWEVAKANKDTPHQGDCTHESAPCIACAHKTMTSDGERLLSLLKEVNAS